MFSFFLHISEGKLGLICFDLLRELCCCHRHKLPLCPFNHQSRWTVFPGNTEIPLLVTVCRAMVVHSGKSSSDLKRVGGGVGGGWWTVLGLTFYSVPSIPNLLCQLSL